MKKVSEFKCDMCHRKHKCKFLCPPMEFYVDQGTIEPNQEKPLTPDVLGYRSFPTWPENLTTTELIFIMFFVDKMKQPEIAEKLYITQQYVSKVIVKYKEIIMANLRKQT